MILNETEGLFFLYEGSDLGAPAKVKIQRRGKIFEFQGKFAPESAGEELVITFYGRTNDLGLKGVISIGPRYGKHMRHFKQTHSLWTCGSVKN